MKKGIATIISIISMVLFWLFLPNLVFYWNYGLVFAIEQTFEMFKYEPLYAGLFILVGLAFGLIVGLALEDSLEEEANQ